MQSAWIIDSNNGFNTSASSVEGAPEIAGSLSCWKPSGTIRLPRSSHAALSFLRFRLLWNLLSLSINETAWQPFSVGTSRYRYVSGKWEVFWIDTHMCIGSQLKWIILGTLRKFLNLGTSCIRTFAAVSSQLKRTFGLIAENKSNGTAKLCSLPAGANGQESSVRMSVYMKRSV